MAKYHSAPYRRLTAQFLLFALFTALVIGPLLTLPMLLPYDYSKGNVTHDGDVYMPASKVCAYDGKCYTDDGTSTNVGAL